MGDQKRGKDAEDEATQPRPDQATSTPPEKQDAPNYKDRTDKGQAIPVDDMSSANDE